MAVIEPEPYWRELEKYLVKKNDGHLVRIVGPGFDKVREWEERGIPFNVACRGIDRYFERYYAKGPRRRPVRIEFCEADILDVFDEWRRAVGVPSAAPGTVAEDGRKPGSSLPLHLERVIARLTALRAGESHAWSEIIDVLVRELDATKPAAKALRGEARDAFLARLRALDRSLLDAVRGQSDAATLAALQREADIELAPFRERMTREAYAQSQAACVDRLLRERARLPVIAFE